MIIRTRTLVEKNDMIRALAYWKWKEMNKRDIHSLSKKEAMKILRESIWWNGKCGWTGDATQVTEALGEFDAFDNYQICEQDAEKFIEKHFPNF